MDFYNKHLLKMLNQEEMKLLHEATCRLLSRVGIKVSHDKITKMLKDNGATVNGNRVCLSQEMVERAIADTAKIIEFKAPDPDKGFTLDASENMVKYGTGGQALYMVNRKGNGWSKDSAGAEDLKKILTLCESLEQVDFSTRPVECDVPEDRMDIEKAKIYSDHCSKPINLANLIKADKLDEIISIIGDPAYISFIVCLVSSPMAMDTVAGDKLLAILDKDLPLAISSCPQGGSTAPFSEIGELIQLNAEILFGFVLANTYKKGAKVLYRGIPITSNLYSDGSPRWCQPDSIRRVALATQLCRYYNLPCCGTAGVSDEETPTAQGITEKVLSWAYVTASGAQYINSALGMLQQVMSVSYYQYVIDDIVLGLLKNNFSKYQGNNLDEIIMETTTEGLKYFGISVDENIKKEIAKRIEHTNKRFETYSEDSMNEQIEVVEKAVSKAGGSTVLITSARKGLRKGYLYTGEKIEGELDLSGIEDRLKSTL